MSLSPALPSFTLSPLSSSTKPRNNPSRGGREPPQCNVILHRLPSFPPAPPRSPSAPFFCPVHIPLPYTLPSSHFSPADHLTHFLLPFEPLTRLLFSESLLFSSPWPSRHAIHSLPAIVPFPLKGDTPVVRSWLLRQREIGSRPGCA